MGITEGTSTARRAVGARTRARRFGTLAVVAVVLGIVGPWLHIAVHDHLLAHHHDSFGTTRVDHDHAHAGDAFAVACKATADDGVSRIVTPGSLHNIDHDIIAVTEAAPIVDGTSDLDPPAHVVAWTASTQRIGTAETKAAARGPPRT